MARTAAPTPSPPKGRSSAPLWATLGLIAALSGLGIWWAQRSAAKARSSPPTSAPASPASTTPAAVVAAGESPFRKLQGRWARVDGDYTLEVRFAGPDGRVEVGYFNPRPIYVSRAEGRRDGDAIKLFVELQDTGYPGCNYTLTYDAAADQLQGTYYQAAMQETYEVLFQRLP